MTTLHLNLGERCYDITVGRGILEKAAELFELERRVMVVTDSGVPREYADKICALCREARVTVVEMGEGSKSLSTLEVLLGADSQI